MTAHGELARLTNDNTALQWIHGSIHQRLDSSHPSESPIKSMARITHQINGPNRPRQINGPNLLTFQPSTLKCHQGNQRNQRNHLFYMYENKLVTGREKSQETDPERFLPLFAPFYRCCRKNLTLLEVLCFQ